MLHVAFELGNTEWTLGVATHLEDAPTLRVVPARDLARLDAALRQLKTHLGCPADAPIHSCYEAGRDGFWLHRYLLSRGIHNVIVDSSSIEVNRRRRRAKTDRLDARKLVTMLMRATAGERAVWHVVRVPSAADEDRRHVHRELLTARRDRARLANRIKGVLAGHGVPLATLRALPTHLATARLWDGGALPPHCVARLTREWDLVGQYTARLRAVRAARTALLRVSDDPAIAQVRRLVQLRGVGPDSAWLYVMEFFAWRQFRNRREVGGLAGLTDTSPIPRTRAATSTTNRGSRRRGIAGSAPGPSTRRGPGSATSHRAPWRAGTGTSSGTGRAGSARSASWRWPGSS